MLAPKLMSYVSAAAGRTDEETDCKFDYSTEEKRNNEKEPAVRNGQALFEGWAIRAARMRERKFPTPENTEKRRREMR